MSAAPRSNKTARRTGTKTVRGVELRQTAVGEWTTADNDFVMRYDEHDRAWTLSRVDGVPQWWGSSTEVDGNFVPDQTVWTLRRSLESAIGLLRTLGFYR